MRRLLILLVGSLVVQIAAAQTSPHGAISWACESCHTTDSWKMRRDTSFAHAKTGFPLEGQHKNAKCISCHKALRFTGAVRLCTACHVDVHKSELGPNCTRCHNQGSWGITDMIQRHQSTRFPLLGRHATQECQNCHTDVSNHRFTGTSITCFGCHSTDYQKTSKPNHAFAGFSNDCEKCHRVNSFSWGQSFDHAGTSFPLTGAHSSVACALCHQNGMFKNTATGCYSCHQTQFQSTSDPNHIAAKFETSCQTCHTTSAWKPSSFSHGVTKFPLTGAHRTVQCKDCHKNDQFAALSSNCIDCHRADFAGTTNPNHQVLAYPQTCTQCHTITAWKPASFDHSTTKFPLTGSHTTTQCALCHVNNNYQLAYTDCYPCHQTDYQRPTNPNHVTGLLDHRCETCHATSAWQPSTFSHSTTKFALTGKHVTIQCQSCHVNGNYRLTYTDCYQCHQADYVRPTSPVHVTPSFSYQCETCHSTNVWSPASFDHNSTKFALTGAHRTVVCKDCHTNSQYATLPMNCIDCHRADFAGTTNPNHQVLAYPQTCTQCHTTTAWTPASFDHGTTKFPLTGTHTTTQCALCHVNNNYQLAYTDCYPCPQTDYQQPTNPNHVTGLLDHRCETCHTTSAWQPSTFNHSTTKFALTGMHVTTQCQSCHVNGNYRLTYTDCYQCHLTDFNLPTNPNHATGGFSHQCQTCHTTAVWKPSIFSHDNTRFPLSGAHRAVACNSCHTNNQYATLPTNCIDCHRPDYTATTNPNHTTLGFPQACLQCHTTTAWKPATFDHNTTKFPLTGKHASTTCQSCHVNANYQVVYTDCYQCHSADFAKPTNPNHVPPGFSHQCQLCHTITAWVPSTFNHDGSFFKIYSGKHRGKWTLCNQCHDNPSSYTAFTCITCHEHSPTQVNSNHSGVKGYVYTATSCYTCHKGV